MSHKGYVNPARIDPTSLAKQGSRLIVRASRQNAVFITTGAVANCNLVSSTTGGSGAYSYRVKNISIFPLSQEYERTISCIGTALGLNEMYGPLSDIALIFSTRKEGVEFGKHPPPLLLFVYSVLSNFYVQVIKLRPKQKGYLPALTLPVRVVLLLGILKA